MPPILTCLVISLSPIIPNASAEEVPNSLRLGPDPTFDPNALNQIFASVCANCHDPSGQGDRQFNAPLIASLPIYHSTNQFRKFQNDMRGATPGDDAGPQMRAIANAIHPDSSHPLA
ncbi:MAG: c-type cytochrome [Verrucomicrobiota bacterium]